MRLAVAWLALALSPIATACASHTTASDPPSRVSLAIGANRLAGLPITPDTSYQRTLGYFSRADQRGSSSFRNGLCRLGFAKIGLFTTFMTLEVGPATPAKCRFFLDAVVTGPRWQTANGLQVGASLASMRHLFPSPFKVGKIPRKRWGPTGSTVWWLAYRVSSSHAARPVLAAYVRGGRVAALGITIVGH